MNFHLSGNIEKNLTIFLLSSSLVIRSFLSKNNLTVSFKTDTKLTVYLHTSPGR